MIKLFLILFFTINVAQAAKQKKPVVSSTKKVKVVTTPGEPNKKIIYSENQTLDFEGLSLDGELKAPGEFYFQNRNQERFDSLTKRRVHFRREMLRDSVQSN